MDGRDQRGVVIGSAGGINAGADTVMVNSGLTYVHCAGLHPVCGIGMGATWDTQLAKQADVGSAHRARKRGLFSRLTG